MASQRCGVSTRTIWRSGCRTTASATSGPRANWAETDGNGASENRRCRTTFDCFTTAISNNAPGTVPLLLVGNEDPVKPDSTNWEYLRVHDGWVWPDGADEDQAFLMVHVMEPWFVADREALRRYFGSEFNE